PVTSCRSARRPHFGRGSLPTISRKPTSRHDRKPNPERRECRKKDGWSEDQTDLHVLAPGDLLALAREHVEPEEGCERSDGRKLGSEVVSYESFIDHQLAGLWRHDGMADRELANERATCCVIHVCE